MTDSQNGGAAAGWYADPTGQAGVRWWDGTQWTAHSAPTPTGATAAPSGPRPRIPDSTPVYTPFIWIYVLLPLVPVIAFLFWNPTFPAPPSATEDPSRYQQEALASWITPAYFVVLAVSLLSCVATVLMAYFDRRALLRAGVVRPFHWAWSFLVFISYGVLVYAIGRAIVVRQVARPRGLVPIWVLIGTMVVSFVISLVWVLVTVSQVFAQIPTSG